MKPKVVILLSAGLDSGTNLFAAHLANEIVLALTFDYGQLAAPKEIEKARKLAASLNIPHKVVDLSFIKTFGGSSLTDDQGRIPSGSDVDIESHEKSLVTAKSVWVPNRNGIFLNIAAGFAEALGAEAVIPGFNKEEATTFPDNSYGFMEALEASFKFSTANQVKVKSYTHQMDKLGIVQEALKLGVNFRDLWPCYKNRDKWCGECESCLRSKRAFEKAGVEHKDFYQSQPQ
ncbi:MAG: 7-cyano-7-deazaguanine synthase QueC [Bdellovibrionota bacterium]